MSDRSQFGKFPHANGIIGLDNGGAGGYWITHSAPQIPHIIDGTYPGYGTAPPLHSLSDTLSARSLSSKQVQGGQTYDVFLWFRFDQSQVLTRL